MPLFNLAEYAKKMKKSQEHLIDNTKTITEVKEEINNTETILESKRRELDSKRKSCEVLDKKVM
jgi:hypothetical protein